MHIQAAHFKSDHTEDGFSILELSIVLIVIAFIVGTTLSLGTSRTGFARLKQSYDKMALIEEAIGAYVSINGKLPCPSDGASLRQPVEAYGYADCDATLVPVGTAFEPDFHVGVLPVQALNMAQEFAFDGWGRRFTYVVDSRVTTQSGFTSTREGQLQIQDNNLTPNIRSQNAIFILFSHGENGYGAWPKEGGKRLAFGSVGKGEKQNVHDAKDFTTMDMIFTQSPRSGSFDDILYYYTKEHIIRRAGGIIFGEACDLAKRTLQPYIDICDLQSGEPHIGPVGCEVEEDVSECPVETREFRTHCVVRQIELAKHVHEKCFYR